MHASVLPKVWRRKALGIAVAAGWGVTAGPDPSEARQPPGAGHVVLLGDSSLDNQAYVRGRPDVVAHLRDRLPHPWRATLAAVDGAVSRDVLRQLAHLPGDATHLVVSVGGNDGLRRESIFREPAASIGGGAARLAALREQFRQDYQAMLDAVLARGLPMALCTIYDPRFADPLRQKLAVAGLALFNDVILRAAFARGLPVIDLRLVCGEDADFANPIEPSDQGGGKIAAAVAQVLSEHDFRRRRPEVFTGGPSR